MLDGLPSSSEKPLPLGMGVCHRADIVAASINKKTKIDRTVKIEKIKPDEEGRTYQCVCCGKDYKRQRNNFAPTKSPLYAGNNGYVPICKSCTDKYYYQLVDFFSGNEEKAIERICGIFDWFYDDDAVAASRRISMDRSRISIYPAKMNLSQSASRGTSYLDYIKLKSSEEIDSMERLSEVNQTREAALVSERTVKRWGLGYTPEEYDILNSHYKTLKDQASDDIVTENLVRELCTIKAQQSRALVNNETDKYIKLTQLYQTTLGSANLKPKSNKESELNAQSDMFGIWTRDIERYTPADFFADKAIYKDYDGLGEYFNRFIVRPFKNLITGSKEMDVEFSIQGDDGDGGT